MLLLLTGLLPAYLLAGDAVVEYARRLKARVFKSVPPPPQEDIGPPLIGAEGYLVGQKCFA